MSHLKQILPNKENWLIWLTNEADYSSIAIMLFFTLFLNNGLA